MDSHLDIIAQQLSSTHALVLTSPPGTGKTTRLPPALMSAVEGSILILMPKKIAAVMAATRIASEQNWILGHEVGYLIRFENKTTPSTKVIFSTEGVFQRLVLEDPDLKKFSLIIFDEFHERALNTDLALAYCKELQELARPDLKIMVMSATINAEKIRTYLGSDSYEVKTEHHDLTSENIRDSQKLVCDDFFYKRVIEQLRLTLADPRSQGHILVFLPGAREISRSIELAQKSLAKPGLHFFQMHSQVPLAEQKQILTPGTQERKVIFCTNIAESSLTVDGVDTVIDSGLHKQVRFNLKTETEILELKKISLFSSRQRGGRANRQKPGLHVKLWNKHDELSMTESNIPDVKRADLSAGLLFLASQGISDFKKFSWFENPEPLLMNWSMDFLKQLKLVSKNHAITPLGSSVLRVPLALRWGLFGVLGAQSNLADFCALALALFDQISQRNLVGTSNFDEALQNYLTHEDQLDVAKIKSDLSLSRPFNQFSQIFKRLTGQGMALDRDQLWLHAFKDRIVKKRPESQTQGVLPSGKGVEIFNKSTVFKQKYFMALSLRENPQSNSLLCDLYLPVEESDVMKVLRPELIEKESVEFDEVKKQFFKTKSLTYQKMTLVEGQKSSLTAAELTPLWHQWILDNQAFVIEKNSRLKILIYRLLLLNGYKGDLEMSKALKFLEDKNIFNSPLIDLWDHIAQSFPKISDLEEGDLTGFFKASISRDLIKELDKKLPESWTLYYGRTFSINYDDFGKAQLEARIQDLLGVKQVPVLLEGALKLTFILLGPHKRPVQITQDLIGFWQGSYQQVRKELRGDYPKHAWPEDPLNHVVVPWQPRK